MKLVMKLLILKASVGLTTEDDYKAKVDLVGSIIAGEFYDQARTVALSKVPSFDDSMAMVAGSINQIMAKLAQVVKEIPSGVVRATSEVQKTKSE